VGIISLVTAMACLLISARIPGVRGLFLYGFITCSKASLKACWMWAY